MTDGLLDSHGHYRDAEYVCQHCETNFKVWERARVAEQCPHCGEAPGTPEVVG